MVNRAEPLDIKLKSSKTAESFECRREDESLVAEECSNHQPFPHLPQVSGPGDYRDHIVRLSTGLINATRHKAPFQLFQSLFKTNGIRKIVNWFVL